MHWRSILSGLLLGALPNVASAQDCTGVKAVSPKCKTAEATYSRDVFFIGGGYVSSGIPGQDMWGGQLYVEKLTPARGVSKPYPLVFVSPGLPSGSVWLNTPDNREGWASMALDAGYQVYIIDITANGRSGQQELSKYPLRLGSTDVINQQGFTAPEDYMQYPQAALHNQWPGTGLRGDPVFDAFTASNIPLSSASVAVENTMRTSGCQLLSMIGQSYSVCHSAGCTYTAIWADQCPDLLRANINIEPGNIPFTSLIGNSTVAGVGRTSSRPCGLTYTPLNSNPPVTDCSQITTTEVGPDLPGKRSCILQTGTIKKLTQVGKVPYIMLTGEASPHITYDHCFVSYFEQMGITNFQWVKLADVGIKGNGHFMFLEKNNQQIAQLINYGLDLLNRGPAAPGHPTLPISVKRKRR